MTYGRSIYGEGPFGEPGAPRALVSWIDFDTQAPLLVRSATVTAALRGTRTRVGTPVWTSLVTGGTVRTATPISAATRRTLTRTSSLVRTALGVGAQGTRSAPVSASISSAVRLRTAAPVSASVGSALRLRAATPVQGALLGRGARTATPVRSSLASGFTTSWRTAAPVSGAVLLRRRSAPVAAALFGYGSRPFLAVEIAFASNPADASPIWTNVVEWVQDLTVKRGRQMELDSFTAGTATVVLRNQDRRFDPVYPASPYAPNIKVGKRMRVTATWNERTYGLFDGYIEAWPQTWQKIIAATVPVKASDAFKRFSLFPLNGDYGAVVRANSPWGHWRWDGSLNDSSGQGNNGGWSGSSGPTYGGFDPLRQGAGFSKFFNGTDDFMTHAANGWVTGAFTLEAWLYPAGWSGDDGVGHGVWQSVAPPWGNPANGFTVMKWVSNNLYFRVVSPTGTLQDLAPLVDATSMPANQWHYWVFTANPQDGMRIYRDGMLFAGPAFVGTLSMPTAAPPAPRWGRGHDQFANMYMAHGAIHNTALAPDQVYDRWKSTLCNFPQEDADVRVSRALDVIGWPAGDRSLIGGAATLAVGPANESLLSYLQKVNGSEVGRLFMTGDGKVRFIGRDAGFTPPYTDSQATFGDGPGELPYTDITLSYDDTRVWNEVRLQRVGGQTQTARDLGLQTTDLVRTYQDSSLLHSNDAQTLSAAQYRLSQYKESVLRVDGMAVRPMARPQAMWPQVLGREIGDRVTIIRRPQRQGTISQQVYIEGVEHHVSARAALADWETRYTLSLADVTTFWILGDPVRSLLGSTTVLSF